MTAAACLVLACCFPGLSWSRRRTRRREKTKGRKSNAASCAFFASLQRGKQPSTGRKRAPNVRFCVIAPIAIEHSRREHCDRPDSDYRGAKRMRRRVHYHADSDCRVSSAEILLPVFIVGLRIQDQASNAGSDGSRSPGEHPASRFDSRRRWWVANRHSA